MSALITVRGLASGTVVASFAVQSPYDNLMDFLRAQGVTIASSCGGEGVCRKCVINGDLISCQFNVEQFLERFPDGVVTVSYL